MNTQDISKEWIDTFNHLGSEGKLKAPVDYHAIFEADELFGKKIKTLAVHAGLECGCFVDKIQGDMDAISIGPNAWDLHSPNERLSVSSTEKVYKFLTHILENLD